MPPTSGTIKVYVMERGDTSSYYLLAKDTETGWRQRRTADTRSRKEAEKAAVLWQAELNEGRYAKPGRLSFEAFRDRYILESASGLAANTQERIRGVLKSVETILKPLKVGSLNSDRISQWQNELRKKGNAETTIKSMSAHLLAALNWAKDVGLVSEVPTIRMPSRAKKIKVMRGRPITDAEFEEMLKAVPGVVGGEFADSWTHYLRGLHCSGLRLAESMQLEWNGYGMSIDCSGEFPAIRIPAEMDKGGETRLLPITPEFASFIDETPAEKRVGFVFNPSGPRSKGGRLATPREVGRKVSDIGKAAKIVVDAKTDKSGKQKLKYATAHDLRRAFGTRWAAKIMPADLQVLMRHETIETTMKYYVGRSVNDLAQRLYTAGG